MNNLHDLIHAFLVQYKEETNVVDKNNKSKYSLPSSILDTIFPGQYPDMILKVGIGHGNLARCPYIIFMDKKITTTPMAGLYVIILFRSDMSGFYLMINQGISCLNYTKEDFCAVRSFWLEKLDLKQNIQANSGTVKLDTKMNRMAQGYAHAFILEKWFDKTYDKSVFESTLEKYLDYYKRMVSIMEKEFQFNMEKMYDCATGKDHSAGSIAVVQLNEKKQKKSDEELYQEFICDLKKDIRQTEGVVFFVGAGLSCALGLPDWNSLVFDLLCKTWDLQIDEVSSEDLKKYVKDYTSPTILAAMVKNKFENGTFEEQIHDIFYERSVTEEKLKNSALGKLARMITARSTTAKAVITYNFDNYLEQAMDLAGCQNEYMVISEENKSKVYSGKKLPVYHVHGFIPKDDYQKNGSKIVFTESEYHELYSNLYHWTNIIQAKYLMDYTCVFLGLSFTDPNQRKILESISEFIPEGRYNYLIVQNKVPENESLKEYDRQLNRLNSAWNEQNYKLKTYFTNGKDYEEVNEKLKKMLDELKT